MRKKLWKVKIKYYRERISGFTVIKPTLLVMAVWAHLRLHFTMDELRIIFIILVHLSVCE